MKQKIIVTIEAYITDEAEDIAILALDHYIQEWELSKYVNKSKYEIRGEEE